jgi:hypothetical protein
VKFLPCAESAINNRFQDTVRATQKVTPLEVAVHTQEMQSLNRSPFPWIAGLTHLIIWSNPPPFSVANRAPRTGRCTRARHQRQSGTIPYPRSVIIGDHRHDGFADVTAKGLWTDILLELYSFLHIYVAGSVGNHRGNAQRRQHLGLGLQFPVSDLVFRSSKFKSILVNPIPALLWKLPPNPWTPEKCVMGSHTVSVAIIVCSGLLHKPEGCQAL